MFTKIYSPSLDLLTNPSTTHLPREREVSVPDDGTVVGEEAVLEEGAALAKGDIRADQEDDVRDERAIRLSGSREVDKRGSHNFNSTYMTEISKTEGNK